MISKEEADQVWKRQTSAREDTKAAVGVNNVGCSGQEYKYDWNPAPSIFPTDIKVHTTVASSPASTSLSIAALAELINILDHLESVTADCAVFDIEFRVQLSDGGAWIVLGFDEVGSPSFLRFA